MFSSERDRSGREVQRRGPAFASSGSMKNFAVLLLCVFAACSMGAQDDEEGSDEAADYEVDPG
jgi:hypothetical protein